jgi:ABC-type phosphate transport system permease subunit
MIAYAVGEGSIEIFSFEGLEFITGTDWNAVYGRDAFGALPYIVGTLVTSTIAMAIGVPVSLGIAVFLSDIAPAKIVTPLSFVIELLAAVPSIVYGLWALFVFRFWIILTMVINVGGQILVSSRANRMISASCKRPSIHTGFYGNRIYLLAIWKIFL